MNEQLVSLNVSRLKDIANERGLNAGGLAGLTSETSSSRSISRSGIQRLLNSDGKDTPLWKIEVLSEALKIQPEMLITGIILKSRQISLLPVHQGTDLRKLFSGNPLYTLEMLTEPGDQVAQDACLDLASELEKRKLIGGTQVEQMKTNFRVRSILDCLRTHGLTLYAARTMQVCPYSFEHTEIAHDDWKTDVIYKLVDENFTWDEGAHYYFDGTDLCDVLILKLHQAEQECLTIEVNTDPANLVSPKPYNHLLIENMARFSNGTPLIAGSERVNLEADDFTDQTAKELFEKWLVEKEKDAKNKKTLW